MTLLTNCQRLSLDFMFLLSGRVKSEQKSRWGVKHLILPILLDLWLII